MSQVIRRSEHNAGRHRRSKYRKLQSCVTEWKPSRIIRFYIAGQTSDPSGVSQHALRFCSAVESNCSWLDPVRPMPAWQNIEIYRYLIEFSWTLTEMNEWGCHHNETLSCVCFHQPADVTNSLMESLESRKIQCVYVCLWLQHDSPLKGHLLKFTS